jgi:hypothetical protein
VNWELLVNDILWPPTFALLWPCALRLLRLGSTLFDDFWWSWFLASAQAAVYAVTVSAWAPAAVSAVQASIALAKLWRRWKGRKRAAKALGEKSRALVAALVQRAREAARPRPVLQPQRQAP